MTKQTDKIEVLWFVKFTGVSIVLIMENPIYDYEYIEQTVG